MRPARIAALFLPALCGCGLVRSQPIGKDANGFDVFPARREPPHALLVEGEIRDFVSLRAEPRAVIETWTDDPNYTPKATVDESGHFSLRIDVCRRDATVGEQFASDLLLGTSSGCVRWLGEFHLRARLGDRCSVKYSVETLPKGGARLVLWLRPCTEVESVKRPQRVEP